MAHSIGGKDHNETNIMKIKLLAIIAGLGLFNGSSAYAQGGPAKPPASGALKHLLAVYRSIAPFDTNKNGKLELAEEDAIVDAIRDEKLELPIPPFGPMGMTPPKAFMPDPEAMIGRLSEMYKTVAATDANNNGVLDANEQEALTAAIKTGKMSFHRNPGGPMGGRPPGMEGTGD